MLDILRRGANTLWVKILLVVLVVSFAVWGIGDFTGGGADSVAKVGGEDISRARFEENVRKEIAKNPAIDPQLARYFVLQTMIRDSLINQFIDQLGLRLSDKVVVDSLHRYAAFYDETGAFDLTRFHTILNQNGLTEKMFLDMIEKEEIKKIVQEALVLLPPVSPTMVDYLFRYQYEKRQLDMLSIPHDHVKNVPEPTDADLVTLHEQQPEIFQAPEFRTIRYAYINCNTVEKKPASEDDIYAYYKEMRDGGAFVVPAKRVMKQALFASESEANEAYKALKEGKTFAAIGGVITDIESSAEGMINELRDVVHHTNIGQFSTPVKSPLGWHIIYIVGEKEASVKSYEEVKETLRPDVENNLACHGVNDKFATIEDAFAGGESMKQAVDDYNSTATYPLQIVEIGPISKQGKGSDGKEITGALPEYMALDGMPGKQHILLQTFALQPDDDPITYSPAEGVYVALELVNVVPKRVLALDELRGLAVKEWKKQQAAVMAKALADEAVKDISESGVALITIANRMGLKVQTTTMQRMDMALGNTNYSDALMQDIFDLQQGQVSKVHQDNQGNYNIAVVKRIIDANTLSESQQKQGKDQIAQSLVNQWQEIIFQLFLEAARAEFPVSVNESVMSSE